MNFFVFLHDGVARQLARRSAGHVRAVRGEEGWRVTGPGEVAQSAARREETGPNRREAGSFLFQRGGYTEDNCLRAGYPLSELTL